MNYDSGSRTKPFYGVSFCIRSVYRFFPLPRVQYRTDTTGLKRDHLLKNGTWSVPFGVQIPPLNRFSRSLRLNDVWKFRSLDGETVFRVFNFFCSPPTRDQTRFHARITVFRNVRHNDFWKIKLVFEMTVRYRVHRKTVKSEVFEEFSKQIFFQSKARETDD